MMKICCLMVVFFPFIAAVCGFFTAKHCPKARDAFFAAAMAVECAFVATLAAGGNGLTVTVRAAVGFGLNFRLDAFRLLYTCVSAFLWLATVLFSREYMRAYAHKERYWFFYFVTLTGVLGVFLSDDLYTTFIFFELMSFASYPLVIHEESDAAKRAGETYLGVAVISGMMLLTGIFFVFRQTGTLAFDALRTYFSANPRTALTNAGGVLILLGFGAKAGMFPLHIWLPQAHPVAPAPASALLSGILTKTGVFGIVVLCADVFMGSDTFGYILLVLAVITMVLGAVLALFSVNLKRTLACSSMSQIGFILVGTAFSVLLGETGGMAQAGALLHMVNHSLIKLVLFMSAGVVAMNLHALDLNAIRGFGRNKPFLKTVFAVGALGIMGVPLFNGYTSKTMLHESILEFIAERGLTEGPYVLFKGVEWIFLLSGGLTVAYMTKLFICVFVERNSDADRQAKFDAMTDYLSKPSRTVFAVSAALLPIIGVIPNCIVQTLITPAHDFYGTGALEETVAFFGFESMKGGVISLAIGALVYLIVVRRLLCRDGVYLDRRNARLDLEKHFYRPLVTGGTLTLVKYFFRPVANVCETFFTRGTMWFIRRVVRPLADACELLFIRGTLLVTGTLVRGVAQVFDRVILLLQKTVFRPYVYTYRERSAAEKVERFVLHLKGRWADKLKNEPIESLVEAAGQEALREYNSFSFAFAMTMLGILIVLVYVIVA